MILIHQFQQYAFNSKVLIKIVSMITFKSKKNLLYLHSPSSYRFFLLLLQYNLSRNTKGTVEYDMVK